MKYRNSTSQAVLMAMTLSVALLAGCGKSGVTLQAAPLAGASAAAHSQPAVWSFAFVADALSSGLMTLLTGARTAFAAVSPFTSFKFCNDTLVMTDVAGNTVAINGSTQQAGVGLLSFSSASTSATSIASLDIAAGTQIKEIHVTSAISTTLCPGFADAVEFDPGAGAIHIAQNTQFKFVYATPLTIDGSAQTINLMFGQIVDGMVALGAGLNDSTIQNVNVGQVQ